MIPTLHGTGQSTEKLGDALKKARPANRHALGNHFLVEVEECSNGNNAQLLVVDAAKRRHAAKPEAEEAVCPALGLEDLKRHERIIVNSIDDHFHEVNLVALGLHVVGSVENSHGHDHETFDALVNVAAEVEHHGLGKLARANALGTSLARVAKHVGNHLIQSLNVLRLLSQMSCTKLDKVVKCWQHVLEVELGARLESGVNQLKSLPHVGRNALGGECAAVNDFKCLVVKICDMLVSMYGE